MKPISNRYELKQLLGPLLNGKLYEGKDLSLQRPVFVYAAQLETGQTIDDYIALLGNVSPLGSTDTPFLHILDVESGTGSVHVIVSYKPGRSFTEHLRLESTTFSQAVERIAALGQALLEAAETRPLQVSLAPENVWVAEDGGLSLINIWERPRQPVKPAKGLSQLFAQMLIGKEQLPADAETFSVQLLRSLDLPVRKKEEVVSVLSEAWKERMTLAAFMQTLQRWLPADIPPISSQAVYDTEHDDTQEEPDDEVDEAADTATRSGWRRIGKRVWLALALTALGLAVCAGMFILLVELMNGNSKSATERPAVEQTAPQSDGTTNGDTGTQQSGGSGNPNNSGSSGNTGNSGNSGNSSNSGNSGGTGNSANSGSTLPSQPQAPVVEAGKVPKLTGLNQQTAEQASKDAGFRYMFYLETNEQPAGTVFKQDPAPDTELESGTRIYFWVSKGP